MQPQNYRLAYWYPVREAFAATLPESHWVSRKIEAGKHLELHELRHTGSTVINELTGDLNASRAQQPELSSGANGGVALSARVAAEPLLARPGRKA